MLAPERGSRYPEPAGARAGRVTPAPTVRTFTGPATSHRTSLTQRDFSRLAGFTKFASRLDPVPVLGRVCQRRVKRVTAESVGACMLRPLCGRFSTGECHVHRPPDSVDPVS